MGRTTAKTQIVRDEARSMYLRQRGYRVVRVPASDVMRNVDEVVQGIVEAALAPSPQLR
jgi:very-short-patch-repair endonuclease